MKSFILTILFLCVISFSLFAQITEPIIVARNGIKKTYLQNGEYLNHDQLLGLLKSRPESESECIMSEKHGMAFGMLALPAVIFVAVDRIFNWVWIPASLNKAANEGKSDRAQNIENTIGLSVLGLAAIGVPFLISSNTHLKKSIRNYNNSGRTTRIENININFGIMGNGVGLHGRF